jgi:integrase
MLRHTEKSHLENHRGIWRVQVRVPPARRTIIGKSKFVKSLGRVDSIPRKVAEALALPISRAFNQQIEQAKGAEVIEDRLVKIFNDQIYSQFFAENDKALMRDLIRDQMAQTGPQPEFVPAPKSNPSPSPTAEPVTFDSIIDAWALQNKRADTRKKFTRMMAKLATFVGHDDASRITPKELVAFQESLQKAIDPITGEPAYHPNTVSNYLGCYNAVFTFAKRSFRIDTNPMADVKIPGKVETDVIPYGLEQVRHILTEGRQLRIELFLSLLVQSFTGVRISEIADRHTSDIKQIEGIWCLDIPKGKTASSKRILPLHPTVVRHLQPYLDTLPGGFLFPKLPRGSSGKPSVYATRKLGEWVRKDLGITDERIEPNHSFRHYVKSQLLKAKVDVKIRDMICGHGKSVARQYEHGDIEQMAEAICLLPNPLG